MILEFIVLMKNSVSYGGYELHLTEFLDDDFPCHIKSVTLPQNVVFGIQ